MPSVSKKQQKFMGIVRAIQKGEADPSDFNKDAQDAAKKMKKSSVKKYAKTKHKGLPNKKVNEDAWTPEQNKAVDKIDGEFNKLMAKKGIEPYSVEASRLWRSAGFNKKMRKIFGKNVKESLTPAEVKKERELFKKTGELPPRLQKVVDDYENERKAFHKKMKKKFKGNVKGDWVDVVVPGLEWMSKLGEAADRDYKAEYKKFQSSTNAQKYSAELNKYNRQKGTYGNGDGKDASHKGGKIVGFEAESKNRGRAEKSRLKKEINDYVGSVIDETINENPAAIAAAQRMVVQSKGKKISVNTARNSRYKDKDPAAHKKAKSLFSRLLDKFRKKNESQMLLQMAKQLKEADESVDEIKVWDLNEKCWKGYEKKGMKTMFGKRYPNCVKKKKSESVNEVSDKQKRKIYKKAFGKEYDDPKRKQAPLPLDIAYKVALNRLKKKKKSESVNEESKVIKSIDNLAKKNKYGTVTGTQMNGKTANTIMKIYNHPKMKKHKKALDNFTSDELVNLTVTLPKTLGIKEGINEFKTIYNKNKAAMKIRSLQRDKGAKVYKVDKKRTKYQGKDLIVYNLFTKNKNHSTNQNPYGLDMMKGAYLIPVEEGMNEFHHNHISDSEKFKVYNSLKKGDIVSIKYDSSIAKGSKFHPFLVTKGKTKLMKGKIERIIMVPAGGSKAKRYLYNRNGRISLALGDMAASIIDMKKGKVNEGTCGYGVGGKLGEEPAGPHLLKRIKKIRKKKKDVNEARLDPKQLLQQLGGNRFIAMTGAKNLAFDKAKNTLHMKIGRNAKGVNHLRIKLTGADLYDMEFLQVRAGNVKVKAKEKGVYNDQLQKMFTKHTGMYTSL